MTVLLTPCRQSPEMMRSTYGPTQVVAPACARQAPGRTSTASRKNGAQRRELLSPAIQPAHPQHRGRDLGRTQRAVGSGQDVHDNRRHRLAGHQTAQGRAVPYLPGPAVGALRRAPAGTLAAPPAARARGQGAGSHTLWRATNFQLGEGKRDRPWSGRVFALSVHLGMRIHTRPRLP